MAKLSSKVQAYIVTRLAQFATPKEVIGEVKELYGIDVSAAQVHHYRIDRPDGKPAVRWVALAEETRTRYRAAADELAITQLRWRLERLEEMVRTAIDRKNFPLAATLLEQAAKDHGGAFTNVRNVKGSADEALARLLGVDPSELPKPG